MMSHESLLNHYKTSFSLRHHKDYRIDELDNLLPFEKEIYISLLFNELEKERARADNG